jgi:hypothetical protein
MVRVNGRICRQRDVLVYEASAVSCAPSFRTMSCVCMDESYSCLVSDYCAGYSSNIGAPCRVESDAVATIRLMQGMGVRQEGVEGGG